ncbi:MAG: amino terminal protease self-immunity [Lacunisphaera sp.]|nr:amino terminal protease self-immunity [Lacunisphaera sp.]
MVQPTPPGGAEPARLRGPKRGTLHHPAFGLVFAGEPGKDVRPPMSPELLESLLSAFELMLFLAGVFLLFRLLGNPERRHHWLGVTRLPPWPVTVGEFVIFVFLMFGGGVFFQLLAHFIFKGFLAGVPDREAADVCVNGAALGLGGIAGLWLFGSMREGWPAPAGVEPPPAPLPAVARLPWARVFLFGAAALVAAWPLVLAVNLGWVLLLRRLGLPDDPQPMLAIFQNARSPLVIIGLLVVACGIAPLYEELLFRGGLYRFCRQKLGRSWALALSGCIFGAVHANLASFLPLSLLGVGLALSYEATGDIRVPVVAHGLFNLNTVFLLLSGVAQ